MQLEAQLHPHASFTHLGYVLTGLDTLARADRLTLTARRRSGDGNPLVLPCRLVDAAGQERRVVFDLLDRSEEWDHPALDEAEVYFKRSFHRPHVEALGPGRAGRVEPFGLNFLCRSTASTRWVFRHSVLPEVWAVVRGARPRLSGRWNEYRSFFLSPEVERFEVPPGVPAAPRVAFQTRVWTRGELGPESEALNEERVAMVRALRRELGVRFTGGLVPTELARSRWPEELSPAPTRRKEHIAWMQAALVAVYTRGLHHSTAFKLPEYLAASRCVVAEPLRNALPRPLLPGKHLLEFRTVEECVARCGDVLASPDLQRRLREAAWEYWREEGRPEVRVAWCLARVQKRPPAAAERQDSGASVTSPGSGWAGSGAGWRDLRSEVSTSSTRTPAR